MAMPFGLSDYTVSLTLVAILMFGVALKRQLQIIQHIVGLQQVILIVLLPALLHNAVINLSMDEIPSLVKYNLIASSFMLFLLVCFFLLWFCTRFTHDSSELRTLGFLFVVLGPGTSSLPYIDAVVPHIAPGNVTAGHAGMALISVLLVCCTILGFVATLLSAHTTRRNAASGTVLHPSMQPTAAPASPKSSTAWRICMQVVRVIFERNTFAVLSALGLLLAGIDLEQTWIWGSAVQKLAACCTPAVFLLIGMKLKFPNKDQMGVIMLMVFRCGLALLFVCGLRNMVNLAENEIMFWLLFCSSSISFIPYGHITSVENNEEAAMLKRCREVLMTLRDACLEVEVNDIAQELDQLSSTCLDGGISSEDAVAGGQELVSRLKDTTVPFDAAHRELLDIELAERTFDPPTALFFITVSTMVSVTVCTIFVVVPVSVLTTTGVLPSLSAAFLVSSITYLARPSLFHRGEHGEHVELGRGRIAVFDNASLDEFTVYEAQAEMLRGPALHFVDAHRQSESDSVRRSLGLRRSTRFTKRCSSEAGNMKAGNKKQSLYSLRSSGSSMRDSSALPTLLAEPPTEAKGEQIDLEFQLNVEDFSHSEAFPAVTKEAGED